MTTTEKARKAASSATVSTRSSVSHGLVHESGVLDQTPDVTVPQSKTVPSRSTMVICSGTTRLAVARSSCTGRTLEKEPVAKPWMA